MPKRCRAGEFTFLRNARMRARLTPTELAVAAGYSLTHYCQVEAGYRRCSDPLLYRLADVLDIDVIEFGRQRDAHRVPPRVSTPHPDGASKRGAA